jgi:ERCC4-type nuclease
MTDLSDLTVWVSAPGGMPATMLRGMGVKVEELQEDEGRVDRYLVSSRVAVERRTPYTFLEGIRDRSLFTSAIYLREHFETPILLLEGRIDYEASGFHPQAIRGALSALILEYGLSVLMAADVDETVHLLAMMARHAQVGVPEISMVPKRKAVSLPDLQRRVVEMLPGCGRVAARELLQTFGSIARIVEAGPGELRRVRGIGEQRAGEIDEVLNAEYRAVDTERDLEDAVEAAPLLLFDHSMTLLARQHVISARNEPAARTAGERHAIDLVFLNPETSDLVLVELKRGPLKPEHEAQLRRYLENAPQSSLLRPYLEAGARLRGILATVSECDYVPVSDEVTVRIVDEPSVIEVLLMLRRRRLGNDRCS